MEYKLLNHAFHHDIHKDSLYACVVNIWNCLPNSVVNVDTVSLHKAQLEKTGYTKMLNTILYGQADASQGTLLDLLCNEWIVDYTDVDTASVVCSLSCLYHGHSISYTKDTEQFSFPRFEHI